jgi:hypothetical protein
MRGWLLLLTACGGLSAKQAATRGPSEADADTDTDAEVDTPAPETGGDTFAIPDTATVPDTAPVPDTEAPVDTGLDPLVLTADVRCVSGNDILATVTANPTTGIAILDLFETGAPVGLGWNEEHDLPRTVVGPPETLERALVDVSSGLGYTRNQSSLFECNAQFAQFASSLTAVVRVVDPVDGHVDCWIWGDDPNMVLAGMFVLYTPVADPQSLQGCTIVP